MVRLLLLFCFSILSLRSSAFAIEFTNARVAGKRATTCRVNVRMERLELFLHDDAGQPLRSFEAVEQLLQKRKRKLAFAMNAGMYHPNGSPVGLFVADGQQLAPLNTADGSGNFYLKPNGVFLVSEGRARVIESSEYPRFGERTILATQSGPMLVRNGRIHSAFRSNSESRLLRNGVGIPSLDVALFVITEEPVNFHELAIFFRDVLHCTDALYFDGVICSLHAPHLQRSDKRTDLGPIIGIATER